MSHLTLPQRQQIATGIHSGKSNGQIARELGVHVSTIGREIKRNSPERTAYKAQHAHSMAASTQVIAAKERFSNRKEEAIEKRPLAGTTEPKTSFIAPSPYASYRIPPLRYHRMSPLQAMAFHTEPRYYCYDWSSYLYFFRCFKPGGLFRKSGKTVFDVLSSWDGRYHHSAPFSTAFHTSLPSRIVREVPPKRSEYITDASILLQSSPHTTVVSMAYECPKAKTNSFLEEDSMPFEGIIQPLSYPNARMPMFKHPAMPRLHPQFLSTVNYSFSKHCY